jgi:hypothetical protein
MPKPFLGATLGVALPFLPLSQSEKRWSSDLVANIIARFHPRLCVDGNASHATPAMHPQLPRTGGPSTKGACLVA